MHPGLRKLFYSLTVGARNVQERQTEREQLHTRLKKIKHVLPTTKKSDMKKEIEKLEKHLNSILDKKLHLKESRSKKVKDQLKKLKNKEKELDGKIKTLNGLLSKVGKKVNSEKFKKELNTSKETPLDKLEHVLYALEQKYNELKEHPGRSPEVLKRVKSKITELKEKIRNLKGP